MKLNPVSTPPRISDYKKINEMAKKGGHRFRIELPEDKLIRPNPPTEAAIKAAQFVDKTYKWNGK